MWWEYSIIWRPYIQLSAGSPERVKKVWRQSLQQHSCWKHFSGSTHANKYCLALKAGCPCRRLTWLGGVEKAGKGIKASKIGERGSDKNGTLWKVTGKWLCTSDGERFVGGTVWMPQLANGYNKVWQIYYRQGYMVRHWGKWGGQGALVYEGQKYDHMDLPDLTHVIGCYMWYKTWVTIPILICNVL